MNRNQARINRALVEMRDKAQLATKKTQRKIERNLAQAPQEIKNMNNEIMQSIKPYGGTINNNIDFSKYYKEIQKTLGGVLIDGEKRYEPYLLDAHSQAVLFFNTLEHGFEGRVHKRLDKVVNFIAPSLVSEDSKGSMTFQTISSGESLTVHYSLRDLKNSLNAVLYEHSAELSQALKVNPELAKELIAERLEKSLEDTIVRTRIEAALSNKPRVWEGSPTQRKLGLKRGMTIDKFAEYLRAEMAAEYLVFMFQNSDIGRPYALAQEYMTTFKRFAPLVVAVKVEHFVDLYNQMPSAFSIEHRTKNKHTIPALRFDKNKKINSEQIWEHTMNGNPHVQLVSPIPSGMFIEQASMYGKDDILKSYARYERINGVRYFRNPAYNSVRRRLFRGYGG